VFQCNNQKIMRIAAFVVIAGTAVAGCSDIYYERRETVASGAADAVASNIAVQTIDPWPPRVADQRITMNGDRAALAAERYRFNRTIVPNGSGTSSAGYQQQQSAQQPAASTGTPTASAGTQIK
jgi:hypothetical protein